MSVAVTKGVKVEAKPQYLEDRSNPERNYYFFAYHIQITNEGSETVQLISRHWIITNGEGHVEEVKGPGVIGEQPTLEPGESFEYSSFCPLNTPTGTMHGTYQMTTEDGDEFDVEIAPFTLAREEITYH